MSGGEIDVKKSRLHDRENVRSIVDSGEAIAHKLLDNLKKRVAVTFLSALENCNSGSLIVRLPDGARQVFGDVSSDGPHAELIINRYHGLKRVMTGGDIGFAEAYLEGELDSPDMVEVLGFALANEAAMQSFIGGQFLKNTYHRLLHFLRRNNKRGARRNIAYHYDLGNDFYSRWLDPSMTYSSAYFAGGDDDLQQAQFTKIRRSLEKLQLQDGSRVLEIGCGWGGLAEVAAREFGFHVTGLTLSREQLAYARNRIAQAGIDHKVDFRFQDYRDTPESFDGIVSIEMFEAVGKEHWGTYFQKVRDRLKQGGRAVIQTIVIRDEKFHSYQRETDFIQKYVFPGGMLPSIPKLQAVAHSAGLRLVGEECFGLSYARTLNLWRQEFERQWTSLTELGFDERFRRLWRYYLIYCEAGFSYRNIDVGQFVFEKQD